MTAPRNIGVGNARLGPARALAQLAALGCGQGVTADAGLDAQLRVETGVFVRGDVPADGGGPQVLAAFLGRAELRSAEQQKSFSGVLEPGSVAAAIALDGDRGYWRVVAGAPPPEAPDSPSFDAPLSFSAEAVPGERTLWVWAADDQRNFGPRRATRFVLGATERPRGELVVALSWDTQSDLDLHLTTPDGTEVFKGNVNSARPTGTIADGESFLAGGRLDFDSNAECVIDGRRRENVVWTAPPPTGRYTVRVDTFSLCDASSAAWRVDVWLAERKIASARGRSLLTDTRFGHDRGAGVLALEFDVP